MCNCNIHATTRCATAIFMQQRDVAYVNEHGSYCWQAHSDYNFRALGETAMFRYKTIIGDEL